VKNPILASMSLFQKIEAKKSLGQHFLNNPHVPTLMAESAHLSEGEVVVEIGPGTGVLTKALLDAGASVVALEADRRAIEALESTFSDEITSGKLVLIHTDVRDFDPRTLGFGRGTYKVVANIPYYLSGRLFRIFLESETHPSDLVFLVQKEVAERIARDKKESILSLSVKVFGEPLYIKTIGKGNFSPAPKVDSAIIAVRNISHDSLLKVGVSFFFKILHLGFASKRKQLLGNLSKQFDREKLVHIFSTLELPLDVRGEDVSVSKWLELVIELRKLG